jgi:hypothetical protein
MDFLDFDKLNAQVSICENIASTVTDDSEYNAVTKRSNTTMMEAQEDVGNIIRNGKSINNKVDFAALENAVNSALGVKKPLNENIDTADKFLNAKPIKQTDFVEEKTAAKESKEMETYNTNTEHKVTEHKSANAVEKQADAVVKEKQKDADSKKEWEENSKKQIKAEAKAILKENATKYVTFVESLRDTENSKLIDGVIKAFNVVMGDMK